jgi:prepilin signal peptidase PulO-like enzyme (type II secretory pathway)
MTDYERQTTTRQTVVQPTADPYVAPAPAPYVAPAVAPVSAAAQTVSTTDTAYVSRVDGATTAARIVTFAFGILQALLIIRIILLLLVANPGNAVVGFVFGITQPFVEPFLGMFSLNRVAADQGSVLDVAAIVALIGWTLIELLILAAIRLFSRRPAAAI